MTKKRANYKMVEEDDPNWQRFWTRYPNRVAKKDARKAWLQLNPTQELVDRIMAALEWQIAEWAKKEWYTPPYPASWLRAERWEDEAPRQVAKQQAGPAAMSVLDTLLGDGTHG